MPGDCECKFDAAASAYETFETNPPAMSLPFRTNFLDAGGEANQPRSHWFGEAGFSAAPRR